MKSETFYYIVSVVVVGAIILGIFAYNQWAYDDWTCAFKNCVQISK